MIRALFRLALKLVVAGALLYLGRLAMQRWVDGPDPVPGDVRWDPAPPASRPPQAAAATGVWLPPAPDGSPPPSHLVKAKQSSGIYHLPGGAAYERTKPDRCYATAEDAEKDGFVKAKR